MTRMGETAVTTTTHLQSEFATANAIGCGYLKVVVRSFRICLLHGIALMRAGFAIQLAKVLLLPISLLGCFAVPKDGPSVGQVRDAADVTVERTAAELSYAFVRLSPLAIEAANAS